MDFAINVFLFGVSPGRAAFKAIRAGLGAALLGGIASIIPGIGTLIGAIAGGVAGDLLGGWIYDVIFGGGKGAGTGNVDEKTAGEAIQDFGAALAAGGIAIWAADKAIRSAGRSGRGIRGALRSPLLKGRRRRIKGKVRGGPLIRGRGRGVKGLTGGLKGGIKGLRPQLGKFVKANALTGLLFAGMNYADRKAMGQNDTQALVGTIAETGGGFAGGAIGGAIATSWIPIPGARIVGALIGGIIGSMVGGAVADSATGANQGQAGAEGGMEDWQMMPGFHKGGIVPMDMTAALKGREMVIDPDSAGPARNMLLAINEASGYQGVMEAISQFAPYDEMRQKTVIVEVPSSSTPPSQGNNEDVAAMVSSFSPFSSGSGGVDPFEILHKGV